VVMIVAIIAIATVMMIKLARSHGMWTALKALLPETGTLLRSEKEVEATRSNKTVIGNVGWKRRNVDHPKVEDTHWNNPSIKSDDSPRCIQK
jgi:hypothetical protein